MNNDDGIKNPFSMVNYLLSIGRFDRELILLENVPARVSGETGEHFFAPDVVERLQDIILSDEKLINVRQVPVYEFCTVA